jgi:hypothetical protein
MPEGRVFFVDEGEDAWRYEKLRENFIADQDVPVVTRPLRDGTTFSIIKIFWDPEELTARLATIGWRIKPTVIGPFYWAEAQRRG